MTTDWQFSFAGVTFGSGTSIGVKSSQGLEDLPATRSGDVPKAGRHGRHPGLDLADGRSVVFELEAMAGDDTAFRSLINSLQSVTTLRASESLLQFKHPGISSRVVYARPRRRAARQDVTWGLRLGRVVVEFFATDPLVYSATEHSLAAGFPVGGVGRTYPRTYPRTYGAFGSGGVLAATNAGSVPAPWSMTITGPWVNPEVRLLGDTLRLSVNVAAGETLTLNAGDESVFLGDAHRLNTVLPGSVWPLLQPGANDMRVGGSSGSGTATLRWRDAWL